MDPKKFHQKISRNMKLDLLLTKSNMDQQVRELMSNELRDKRKTFDKLSHSCNMTNKKSTEIDEADLRRAKWQNFKVSQIYFNIKLYFMMK